MTAPRFYLAASLFAAAALGTLPPAWATGAPAPTSGPASSATPALPLAGRWLTASGNLEIDIEPCGDAWCGRVARVLDNRSMSRTGAAMPATAVPAVEGMAILKDLRQAPCDASLDPLYHRSCEPVWWGRIYNRENDRHYDCVVHIDGHGHLVVRAYVGLPAIGQTQIWQSVPALGDVPGQISREASRR